MPRPRRDSASIARRASSSSTGLGSVVKSNQRQVARQRVEAALAGRIPLSVLSAEGGRGIQRGDRGDP